MFINPTYVFLLVQAKNSLSDQFLIVLKAGKVIQNETTKEIRSNIVEEEIKHDS